MEFNVIKEFCFCLQFEELEDLIIKNQLADLDVLEDNYEEVCKIADTLDFICYDTDCEFGFNLYELEWRTKLENLTSGVIFALQFDRDTLFEKYENYDDIYAEIYSKLKHKGIKLEMAEIKKHCVLLEGIEVYD